jgi:RNA polymerase sigma-70 factor (ECF subfamily)
MAGQAILGETVLKKAKASEAEDPVQTMEVLVSLHGPMVFRIAYSILRNHQDAEDAAQECFLRVLKAQGRWNEVRHMKTWLARIAWTTAIDQRSRRAASSANEEAVDDDMLAQLPDARRGSDEQVASGQMRVLLERLIAGLPEELRQPLELSTVQELNSAEIAELMGIPEGSVRTRLLRARRLLKDKMAVLLEPGKETRNHG